MSAVQQTSEVQGAASARPNAMPVVRHRDTAIYLLLTVLVFGAWQFSSLGLFDAASDTAYWIGVTGGSLMLLLLLYPVRKRFRFMRNFGHGKYWFIAHMVLGIAGPLLILIHSTFKTGSLNAAVALYSMLIVAGSGVVGRYLYVRIHRGLYGEQASLAELRSSAGLQHDNVKSRLHFAPLVEARLFDFEAQVAGKKDQHTRHLWNVSALPIKQFLTYRWCAQHLNTQLAELGAQRGWSRDELRARQAKARAIAFDYLASVVRVAQFGSFVRLFSLWHVLHVPLLYVMVVSAVVHVVAVHIY